MQLILRPVSDARLREIIVTESRFAIGRNEEHFDAYERSIVAKLSRRHARIFERDGVAYIADLHSSNGTSVNGQIVEGEPVALQLNDEVQFGGLVYRVEHLGGDDRDGAMSESEVNVKIVLKPVHTEGSLKPIVVAKFPFLISRYSDAFSRYQESIPQHLSFISKKHAHFYVDNGAVYLEDLGSTNGTYVSGEELDEHARKLVDGDTIAFGGDRFVYEIQLFVGNENIAKADEKIERLVDGTIFVDDATNFFEIYMGAGDDEEEAEAASDDGAANRTMALLRRRHTRVGRTLRFIDELRSSFRDGEPLDRRLRWILAASLAAVLAGTGGYLYLVLPAQRVEDLVDSHHYLDAAELADEYLASRRGDERLEELGTKALLNAFVPDWQQAMVDGRTPASRQLLEGAREVGSNNSDDDELLDVLALATELGSFEAYEGGGSLSVDILDQNEEIGAYVAEWEARQKENARAMSRVAQQVDGFDSYQAEFYRKLRTLRSMEKDLEPILEFHADVAAALAGRDVVLLRQLVRDFVDDNPSIEGLDSLQEDMRRYELVEQDVDAARWLSAYVRLNQVPFNLAPFVEHTVVMNRDVLPDTPTREAYTKAVEAWKAGDTDVAFGLLEELAQQRWGEVARRELDRDRRLLASLQDLQANGSATDFEDRLFTLYAELDPDRDIYLRLTLQPDFQRHSEAALERAADNTSSAARAWNAYVDAGRLQTVHRLEERVSSQFRNLARLLTTASRNLRASEGIYQQLNSPPPPQWQALNQQVIREIKFQTGALAELLVIEPGVQKAKLELLPSPGNG